VSVFLVPCAFRRGDQCDLAPILEHTRSVHSTGTHTQIPGATQLRPRDARRLPCVALGHTPIVGSSPVAGDAAQRDTHQIPCEAPTTGTHTNFLCTQPRLHGGSQTRTHIDFLESMCVPCVALLSVCVPNGRPETCRVMSQTRLACPSTEVRRLCRTPSALRRRY